jgi:hypothetical protein
MSSWQIRARTQVQGNFEAQWQDIAPLQDSASFQAYTYLHWRKSCCSAKFRNRFGIYPPFI